MSEPVPVLFDRTYGMSFPPSPTQFAVPSFARTPAVIPKGGMSEVSTEPEEPEEETPAEGESTEPEEPEEETPAAEESTEEEASDEEAVEGEQVPGVAAGAAEVIVMKVLGKSPPPPPPWCLRARTERARSVAARTCIRAGRIVRCLVD